MLRKTIIVVVLAAFLLVSSLASASQMSQSQPSFLSETGATSLTVDEMECVRGEFLPGVCVLAMASYYMAVYGLPFALSYVYTYTTGSWYVKEQAVNAVKDYFGW